MKKTQESIDQGLAFLSHNQAVCGKFELLLQRQNPTKPNRPIVLLTNLARDAVLKPALAAGAMACLIKTDFNPDQLVAKIREFLSQKGEKPKDPTVLMDS